MPPILPDDSTWEQADPAQFHPVSSGHELQYNCVHIEGKITILFYCTINSYYIEKISHLSFQELNRKISPFLIFLVS